MYIFYMILHISSYFYFYNKILLIFYIKLISCLYLCIQILDFVRANSFYNIQKLASDNSVFICHGQFTFRHIQEKALYCRLTYCSNCRK